MAAVNINQEDEAVTDKPKWCIDEWTRDDGVWKLPDGCMAGSYVQAILDSHAQALDLLLEVCGVVASVGWNQRRDALLAECSAPEREKTTAEKVEKAMSQADILRLLVEDIDGLRAEIDALKAEIGAHLHPLD